MQTKSTLHGRNINDVTRQENPLAYGEYLAKKLDMEQITKTALAQNEGIHRSEVYRYLKMAGWCKDIKALINTNREILTNTDIIKAANSCGKDQQKVFEFLNMSIEKRSPNLKLVSEPICNTECNTDTAPSVNEECNAILEQEMEHHTLEVKCNKLTFEKWWSGFVTFVTNPAILIVTFLIGGLTALLVSMQTETYSSENVSHGFLISVACESLLVVFSGFVSLEKKWLSKIFLYLIIFGLFTYNMGVMSFGILIKSEENVSSVMESNSELRRLNQKRKNLEKSLASYQSSGAVGWVNKTNEKIDSVDKKITLVEKKTKSSMSIILLKSKAWGLVILRFLMMISVVVLTHFLIRNYKDNRPLTNEII